MEPDVLSFRNMLPGLATEVHTWVLIFRTDISLTAVFVLM